MDYIYVNVVANKGDIIDMGTIRLVAGDANRDGIITLEDISLTKAVIDMDTADPDFKENYNPVQTGTVMLEDLAYVKLNQDEELEIVYFK